MPTAKRSPHRFAFKSDTLAHRLRALIDNPPATRVIWWDSTREGFGFRVSPNLTAVYVYRYRHATKQRVLALGRFKKFSDATAAYTRATAQVEKARRALDEGGDTLDPVEKRRQQRSKARAIEGSISVADAVPMFLADRERTAELRRMGKGAAGKGLRRSTAAQYRSLFNLDLIPALGKRPMRSIKASDVAAVCDRAKNRDAAATASRLHDAIGSLFTWAVERDICESNPARGKGIPAYYAPAPRTRVLNESEIAALFRYAGEKPSTPWLALLFTLTTAQRSGELLKLRQSDVQGDVLTIPPEVAKTGRAHRVPLSPLAQEIIAELRARAGKSEWLFPGKNRRDSLQQQTLRITIRRALKKGKLTVPFAAHDLRRTARTQLSAIGVPEYIGELILAHGIHSDVARHYAHHSFENEMRDALNKWSDRLCELRGKQAAISNVVAFPKASRGAAA
jgi:integrase